MDNSNGPRKVGKAVIIGGSIGGVVLLAAIVVIILFASGVFSSMSLSGEYVNKNNIGIAGIDLFDITTTVEFRNNMINIEAYVEPVSDVSISRSGRYVIKDGMLIVTWRESSGDLEVNVPLAWLAGNEWTVPFRRSGDSVFIDGAEYVEASPQNY
jgi:hypothetical protein